MEGEGRRRERSLLFGDKADMMAIRKLEIIGNSHRAKPMRLGKRRGVKPSVRLTVKPPRRPRSSPVVSALVSPEHPKVLLDDGCLQVLSHDTVCAQLCGSDPPLPPKAVRASWSFLEVVGKADAIPLATPSVPIR